MLERDEFGNLVEGAIARPLPAFLHPYVDEFELGNLGRPAPTSMRELQDAIDGLDETGRNEEDDSGEKEARRPKGDMPMVMPQRGESSSRGMYKDFEAVRAAREAERRAEEYCGII